MVAMLENIHEYSVFIMAARMIILWGYKGSLTDLTLKSQYKNLLAVPLEAWKDDIHLGLASLIST